MGEAIRVVTQRCTQARLLVDAAADQWVSVKRGLIFHLSFTNQCAVDASFLSKVCKSLLTAPLSTADQWSADHSDAESIISLCKRGVPQSILVIPQASLVAKLNAGDKYIKYHSQSKKADAQDLYNLFRVELRKTADILTREDGVCAPGKDMVKAAFEQKQRERLENLCAPEVAFKDDTLYSKYDDRGVPTHDVNGEELAKSQKKKQEKMYALHVKRWEKQQKGNEAEPAETTAKPEVTVEADHEHQAGASCDMLSIEFGTFGGRQGFEMESSGPFTHMFAF